MVSTLTLDDLKTRALEFVQLMATNSFAGAHARLDDSLKNIAPEAKLAESWRQLIDQSGALRQLVGIRTEEARGYRIVLVALQFRKATIDVQTVFNEQGNIAGISFIPAKASAVIYHPPAYVNPAAFRESEVTVGAGEWALPGTLTEQQKSDIETLKIQAARVKGLKPSDTISAKDLPLRIPAAYWLDLQGYQPAEVAKSLPMPMLVLQGGRDYQVTAAVDFKLWESALKDRANATLTLYPKLNHLFIAGEGPSNPQEYSVEGHVDEDVIVAIARWIEKI